MDAPESSPLDQVEALRRRNEEAAAADARATRIFVRVLVIGVGVLLVWMAIVMVAFIGR